MGMLLMMMMMNFHEADPLYLDRPFVKRDVKPLVVVCWCCWTGVAGVARRGDSSAMFADATAPPRQTGRQLGRQAATDGASSVYRHAQMTCAHQPVSYGDWVPVIGLS